MDKCDQDPHCSTQGIHMWWSPAESIITTSNVLCSSATSNIPTTFSSSTSASFKLDNVILNTTPADVVPQPRRNVNGLVSDNHFPKTVISTSLQTLEDKSELYEENGDLSTSSTSLLDKPLQETVSPLPEQILMEEENETDCRVVCVEKDDKTPAHLLETWKAASNGIHKLVITKTKGKYRKKQPEGVPPQETSSDNESQSDDSNDSSSDSGNSSSSDSGSSGTTSDSGDVTTHQHQVNDSSEYQETQFYSDRRTDESLNEEPPSEEDEDDPEPLDLKARPEFPSPAHDASTSLCLTSETCQEQDSDSLPAPLDLCIKKHEEDSAMTIQTEDTFSAYNSCIPLPSAAPLVISTASSQPSPREAQKRRRKFKIPKDIEQKQKNELNQKINSEVKHQKRQQRLTHKLQEREADETRLASQFPVTSPTKTQVKKGKVETKINASYTVVTTSNNTSLQSVYKDSQPVTLNVGKLVSYMLPQSSLSKSRGRGRPRGRGRGRRQPSIDISLQRRDKSPSHQTQRKMFNENLSFDEHTSDSKSSSECEASDVGDGDDEKCTTVNTASSDITSTSGRGIKRHSYGSEVGSSPKKKRILPDETEIRIPLEHGWRRQTKIRCFSRSGVRGEVVYFAPCGKKLRNYPEVVRYLQRHGITDITRENFTFSTKINVGEFLERASEAGRENYIMVSEQEVVARIEEVRSRKGCLGIQVRRTPLQKTKHEEKQQYWEQIQLQHRLEQQEETQQAQELKKLGKQRKTKKSKGQKAEELREKDHEKIERLEQVRLEKDMKAKQFLEEKQKKKREAAVLREQERERRRQHTLLVRALEGRKKHEERERKREELLQEKRMYRERKMEERRIELQLIRELKKPVDDMMLKDTNPLPALNRIPGVKVAGKAFANILMVFEFLHNFGDALGFDGDKLPTLSILQLGLLNFDDKSEQELLSVVKHLLVCITDDPGVANRPEAVSILNQNLRDVDVTNNNVSEVLRLVLNALDGTHKMCKWVTERPFLSLNPTQKSQIIAFLCNELLCSRAVLRQIDCNIETVNNLRRDKWIVEANLRKLRNIQQTRALKSLVQRNKENSQTVLENSQMNNVNREASKTDTRITMNGGTSVDNNITENKACKSAKENKVRAKYEEEENDVESGNESDVTQATSRMSDGEDEELGFSNEELEKKIEKLSKQQAQFHSKLTKAAHTIRGTCFGEDRYGRLYWVTPCAGGIFVEGIESSGMENENISEQDKTLVTSLEKLENKEKSVVEESDKIPDKDVMEPQEEKHVTCTKSNLKEINSNMSEKCKPEEGNSVKISGETVPWVEEESESLERKENTVNTNDSKEKVESTASEREQTKTDSPSHYFNVKKESPTKLKSSSDVLPEPGTEDDKSVEPDVPNTLASSVPSVEQNWLLHSPFFASVLAGSMLMNGPLLHGRELKGSYLNLPKIEPSVSSSSFNPLLGLTPTFLSAEQMLKTLSEKQKPWFSVLPRIPCDSTSIIQGSPCKHIPSKSSQETHSTLSNSSQPPTTSHSQSTPTSSMAGHTSTAAALALANLHLGLLNGLPPPLMPNPLLNPSLMNSLYTTTESSRLTSTPYSLSASVIPPSFCSTPSSVPSPSSTPGPVPYGSYSNCSLENSLQAQQSLLSEKLNQYATPRAIPKEYQKGWWTINDVEQLKSFLNSLHPRGVRERHLQKQLQKHFNYVCHAFTQGQQKAADLEISDTDRESCTKSGGAPDSDKEDQWSPEVSLRVDLAILEHVEDMEEKVARASMQMKQGWKVPSKLSSDPTIKFKPACLMLKKENCSVFYCEKGINYQKKEQYISVDTGEKTHLKTVEKGSTLEKETVKRETENSATEDKEVVYENNASSSYVTSGDVNPVDVAKERLLLLESAIERRYIGPPLGVVTELNLSSRNSCNSCVSPPTTAEEKEEELPKGLLRWRASVQKCQTADQLAMCLNMLEACIAWDRSIMRASCQFCHSGANEEMLLLCDGCDKGYHTYCFKPKMETIPDGDWYCYECLNKATGDKVCVLCGKKGKLIRCDMCPKTYHIDCLDPPLLRPPKGKWTCVSCKFQLKKTNKPKLSLKEKDREKEKERSKEVTPNRKQESNSNKSKINNKKERSKPLINKELAAARTILEEMELHEDSWPFLLPVDTKQFPTYKKVIKKPMDLSTIRSKLEAGLYKTKEDFSVDVRLIFGNCETFNEDESPVGRAGHNMRAYFDSQWAELNSS